jgi:hypothetical protein
MGLISARMGGRTFREAIEFRYNKEQEATASDGRPDENTRGKAARLLELLWSEGQYGKSVPIL